MVRTIHDIGNVTKDYVNCEQLFSISEAVKAYTDKQGYDSVTILNGINIATINIEKQLQFQDGKLHFVQVSRLHAEKKGQDVVIKAMKVLAERGYRDSVVMHFIGDGASKEVLQVMAEELDVKDMIAFEGGMPQQEVYKRLASYDLFIQASRYEGFGLTIAEGMAAKIPVMVSNVEDQFDAQMEVIGHGKYGYHFKSGSSEDLAVQLEQFIKAGRNEQMVEDAYNYAKNNFDIRVTTQKYLDSYKQLINK